MRRKISPLHLSLVFFGISLLQPLLAHADYSSDQWGTSYSSGNSNYSRSRTSPVFSLELDRKKRLNSDFRIAIREDRIEYARHLLQQGAEINGTSQEGETALMYATQNCSVEAMEFLLKRKADVNARDTQGRTALILAARNSCVPAVLLLSKMRGIQIEAKDHLGNRAEDYAVTEAVIEVGGPATQILQILIKERESL